MFYLIIKRSYFGDIIHVNIKIYAKTCLFRRVTIIVCHPTVVFCRYPRVSWWRSHLLEYINQIVGQDNDYWTDFGRKTDFLLLEVVHISNKVQAGTNAKQISIGISNTNITGNWENKYEFNRCTSNKNMTTWHQSKYKERKEIMYTVTINKTNLRLPLNFYFYQQKKGLGADFLCLLCQSWTLEIHHEWQDPLWSQPNGQYLNWFWMKNDAQSFEFVLREAI